jgi:hypothetical protein
MAIEHDEFPSLRLPLCVACQRLRRPVRGRWACAAFPDKIPAPLLNASADHREPYPGDQGIRFEPDWGAPAAVLALVTDHQATFNKSLDAASESRRSIPWRESVATSSDLPSPPSLGDETAFLLSKCERWLATPGPWLRRDGGLFRR